MSATSSIAPSFTSTSGLLHLIPSQRRMVGRCGDADASPTAQKFLADSPSIAVNSWKGSVGARTIRQGMQPATEPAEAECTGVIGAAAAGVAITNMSRSGTRILAIGRRMATLQARTATLSTRPRESKSQLLEVPEHLSQVRGYRTGLE